MSDRRSIDTTSIVCIFGVLTVLLAVPAPYILGLFKEGYNPLLLTISELGETGAPTAPAATELFAAIGVCEILFAVALALRFKLKAAALVGSIFMAVNGLFDYVGSAVFPSDAGGLFESPSGQMHFLVSVIGMSVMIFPAFFYARAMKKEAMAKESRVAFAFACAIVGAAAIFNLSFFTETLVGVAQRVVDLAYFGWILYVSIALFPQRPTVA